MDETEALMPALEGIASAVADATQRTNDTARLLRQKLDAIGRISAIIRTVARQSKLLALNASIEAARAGAEGRGFGIVATEMKSLASQADGGASEIEAYLAEALAAAEQNEEAASALSEAVAKGVWIVGQIASRR